MKKNKIIALTTTLGLGFLLTLNSNTGIVHSTYNNNSTINSSNIKASRTVGQTLTDLIPDVTLANALANSIPELNNLTQENKLNQPLTLEMIENLKSFNSTGVSDYTGLDTFYNLESLSISSELRVLPNFFNNFRKLQNVTIDDTTNLVLPESFGNITTLITLNINNSSNITLPDSFGNLSSLLSLTIDGSSFNTLPNSIYDLASLQNLTIKNRPELTNLPEGIGSLSKLKTITLKNIGLINLPESFNNLTTLTDIKISDTQLEALPENIGDLINLKLIELPNNKINTLPESLGTLENLGTLNLYNNNISSLPNSIGNLSKVNILEFSKNKLTILPDSLTNLSRLRILSLGSNKLIVLPNNINNLTQLTDLDVSNNELTKLPDNITKLSNLNLLYADSNKITVLPENISDLELIEELTVSNNLLTSLPLDMSKFKKLYLVDFSNNQITNIPESFLNATAHNNGMYTLFLEDNLLSSDIYKVLSEGGVNHLNSNVDKANMKKLELKQNLMPITLNTITDYTNIDLNKLVTVKKETYVYANPSTTDPLAPLEIIDTIVSYSDVNPNNILQLTELVDEAGNSVSINDYIQNNKVIKSARLFAKISIKQTSGILTNENPNTTTIDQISFTLTKSPDLVVEPETVTPSINKQDPIINGLGLDANAIEANNDNITNNTLVLPTTGNDTNIIAITSVLVLSLSYVLTRKKFN